jgi:hypothetical protein
MLPGPPVSSGGVALSKAAEYRNYAEECRSLAQTIVRLEKSRREQLLKVADAWEKLAAEHECRFRHASAHIGLWCAAARLFVWRAVHD